MSAGGYECGDLHENTFGEIWTGDKYETLRKTYNTDSPAYFKCSACYMDTGWDPNDYKSHFHQEHWEFVKKKLQSLPPEKFDRGAAQCFLDYCKKIYRKRLK